MSEGLHLQDSNPGSFTTLAAIRRASSEGAQKDKGRHNGRSLLIACSAFGNDRRRRRGRFTLAVVRSSVLCGGTDGKKSQRCSRQ
jgi:hypothetical protein